MDASSPRCVPVHSAYLELLCCPFSETVFSKGTCHRRMSRAAGGACLLFDTEAGAVEREEGCFLPSQSSGSPSSLGLVLSPYL